MTIYYTIMQIFYWAMFCVIYAFANNYLSDKGFNPSEIGIIIALSSLISVFIQPLTAKLIYRYKSITVRKALIFSLLLVLFGNLILYFFINKIIISILYILIIVALLNSQTYIYTFIFEYINKGIEVDFGIARGMGSLAFAITSLTLGKLGSIYNFYFLPFLSTILTIIVMFTITFFKPLEKEIKEEKTKNTNFFDFMIKYKKFTLLMIGIIFIFITHNILNTFLKNIIEVFILNEKIVSKQIGIGFMISAMVELPVMYFINTLSKKFGYKKLLIICSLFFTLKVLMTALSVTTGSLIVYYVAQLTQIGSYAIYVPMTVYYTNEIMEDEDRIRGQAYIATAATIGAIIGTVSGGEIIRNISVVAMIYFGVIVSIIGSLIMIFSLEDVK